MSNYFTTFTIENGGYVGTVYNSQNNAQVYKTPAHSNQILAMRDTNHFIKNNQQKISLTPPAPTSSEPRKRCCGR